MTLPEENLELWNKHRTPDPKFTKEVSFGRKFTAIDPQYQLRQATIEWGRYGDTWQLSIEDFEVKDIGGIPTAMLHATLEYPDGAFDVIVDMPFKNNADTLKKLLTNARSKALSMLGFGADVYMGMFDDTEYVKEAALKTGKGHDEFVSLAKGRLANCKSGAEVDSVIKKVMSMYENETIPRDAVQDIVDFSCTVNRDPTEYFTNVVKQITIGLNHEAD